MNENISSIDFTLRAEKTLYAVVNSLAFEQNDSEQIFNSLLNKQLKCHSFGDYLKRYIYNHHEFGVPFDEVELSMFQIYICDAFIRTRTPNSFFRESSAKIKALSKNWLTQKTVSRKIVFLLGFALKMYTEDVNDLLTKGLQEQKYNPYDPFEVICWYCHTKGYGYDEFERLYSTFVQNRPNCIEDSIKDIKSIDTERFPKIKNEVDLDMYLQQLITSDCQFLSERAAKNHFNLLMKKAKEIVADIYNRDILLNHKNEMSDYRDALYKSDKICREDIDKLVDEKNTQIKMLSSEDITESDLEKIISSAIPIDKKGNLTPSKKSKLHEQFQGKRFSRQRIKDILTGKIEISRFDLITLNFFVLSQDEEMLKLDKKRRSAEFVDCGFRELYVGNPYECFLLMCMLSIYPLGTYADVLELSYNQSSEI